MKKLIALIGAGLMLASCVSDDKIATAVKKAIKEDPTLIAEAIKAHPAEIMQALQTAARDAKDVMAKQREEDEKNKLMNAVKNPLKPSITDADAIRGTKGAPIQLVEYSDFQCPYCTKGYEEVVKVLLKKYDGKIQFVYKHLPLSFHSEARIAAHYYEALRIQKEEYAHKFHDKLFTNEAQQKLRQFKEKYLQTIAKEMGANMKKLAADVKSDSVEAKVKADEAEAGKFEIQGTPGFVLNGVPIRGAYPIEHFEDVLKLLQENGKLKI